MNELRQGVATLEELREEVYAGIHTIQITLPKVPGDFSKEKGRKASIVNINKYARQRGNRDYYIRTFEEYRYWFLRFVAEYFPGVSYTIQRVDIMFDSRPIPWKKRVKYDIAVIYAMLAKYGAIGRDCVMQRYEKRRPSILVPVGKKFDVVTYDRTKKTRDTSGVQDRLEVRLKVIQNTNGRPITDIDDLRGLLSGLAGKLPKLDFKSANEAAASDIVRAAEIEREDGGRGYRPLTALLEEEEYRVFSSGVAANVAEQLGVSRRTAYNYMSAEIPGKISGADFKAFTRLLADKLKNFVNEE